MVSREPLGHSSRPPFHRRFTLVQFEWWSSRVIIVQFSGIRFLLFQIGQLYSSFIVTEIANGNFLLLCLATFPRLLLDRSDFSFSVFSYREKVVHDRLHSNFWKIKFHSKIKRSCFSQGQTSKYDRLAQIALVFIDLKTILSTSMSETVHIRL